MIYSIFPSKDATLYEASSSINTGLDQIIELTKIVSESNAPGLSNTRIAMDFDVPTAFSASIANGTTPISASYINLYITKAESIPTDYSLVVKELSQTWTMGVGKLNHRPKTEDGVSWDNRSESGSTAWTMKGGTTSSNDEYKQSFSYESADARVNVSSSITELLSNTIYGFLIQRSGSEEVDNKTYGSLKFFSRDTNTIYTPKMEFCWMDSEFSTGSLTPITSSEILLYIKNNRFEYKENSRVRFDVRGRDINPQQTYATTSAALENYYIPSASYYSVMDANTEDTVVPFDDDYTRISCTSTGNHFDLWMDGLQAERTYKIIFKVKDRNYHGQVEYFDNNHLFKVIR